MHGIETTDGDQVASNALPGRLSLPQSFAKNITAAEMPPTFIVDVALSESAGVATMLIPGFMTINGRSRCGFRTYNPGGGFHGVIQVNHLLIRVARAPWARLSSYGRIPHHCPFRFHPNVDSRELENCWYADAFEFENSLLIKKRG